MSKITAYDVDILARTIYGEARGEPQEGQLAVGLVVRRRWRNRRHAGPLAAICTAPWQFSCWNANDPNRAKLLRVDLSDLHLRVCTISALRAIDLSDEAEADLIAFADHYMTRELFERAPPSWARGKKPCAQIGAHVFFNDINGPAPKLPVLRQVQAKTAAI